MQCLSLPRPPPHPVHVHGNPPPSPILRTLQSLPEPPRASPISSGVQSRPPRTGQPASVSCLCGLLQQRSSHTVQTPGLLCPWGAFYHRPGLCLRTQACHSAKARSLPFRRPPPRSVTAGPPFAGSSQSRATKRSSLPSRGRLTRERSRAEARPWAWVRPRFPGAFPARAPRLLNVSFTRAPSLLARRPPRALPALENSFLRSFRRSVRVTSRAHLSRSASRRVSRVSRRRSASEICQRSRPHRTRRHALVRLRHHHHPPPFPPILLG